MRGQTAILAFFIILFVLLIDLYTFRGISALINASGNRYKITINVIFWLITGITLIWISGFYYAMKNFSYQQFYRYATYFMGFFILFYVPKLFFILFQFTQDLIKLAGKIAGVLFPGNNYISDNVLSISRSDFILQLGVIIATVPFLSILWGMWKGKYNYRTKELSLSFSNLPGAFSGTTIIQISDLHLGSFAGNSDKLEPAIEMVNKLGADYIFFTGDMINNIAREAEEFMPLLKRLTARYGKYSILGNHDYGDYYQWPSESARLENFNKLIKYHEEAGFTLLRNESLFLEKDDEKIGLIGVENWGSPPFPQYGDLKKAYSPVRNAPFKILLSHDPSHWDAEVKASYDIDLTLSGHTHGLQFALSIPGWRWSPVKFKYPKWAGLYSENHQYLYVNIGLGFIGFPGRVGTPPEITVLTLTKG